MSERDFDADVRHIVELMTAGEWSSRVARRLAEEWAIDVSAVRRRATDASRRIARGVDREEVTGAIVAGLERAQAMAEDERDVKGYVQALKLRAELYGMLVQKHDVQAHPWRELPPEEQARRLRAALPAMQAELARLEAPAAEEKP